MKLALLLALLIANALGTAAAATDLPTGGVVAAGTASFATGANSLQVNQGSNRAIINWNSFSVGAGNTVQFVQPSTSSAVLNRVVAANPSQIYGSITANGRVFLVNPNGIIVGPTGKIDASGIFLTTADITDADFLAGDLRFQTPPADVSLVIAGELNATHSVGISSAKTEITASVNAPQITVDGPMSELLSLGVHAVSEPKIYGAPEIGTASLGVISGEPVTNLTFAGSGYGSSSTWPATTTGGSLSLLTVGEGLTLSGGMAGNYNLNFTGGNITVATSSINFAGAASGGSLTLTGGGNLTLTGGSITNTGMSGSVGAGKFDTTASTRTSATVNAGNLTIPSAMGHISIASAPPILTARIIDVGKLLRQVSGSMTLRGTSSIQPAVQSPLSPGSAATTPPPALRASAPTARLVNTGSLVDGAVTVRMPLVDASAILFR